LQGRGTLLTDQSLARFAAGGGTGLCGLLDHAGSQPMNLLIDGLFNLGERSLRMGCSPLGYASKDLFSQFFPPRL
jgi:hypothetical protein